MNVKDKVKGKVEEMAGKATGNQDKELTGKARQRAIGGKATPVHVVHRDGQWLVEQQGESPKPLSTHTTREKAVAAGKVVAKQERTELIVHRVDGTIGERNSYGGDSPAKG